MIDDVHTAATRLLRDSAADPWAWLTPSTYESARLVSDAPWLAGHDTRLRALCGGQGGDGSWGQAGFAFNSTLSATEALLAVRARQVRSDDVVERSTVGAAADRGLAALREWVAPGGRYAAGPPSTISVELIVPMLINRINGHLDAAGVPRLPVPAGCDTARLAAIRADAAAGRDLPADIWHAWEIATPAAAHWPDIVHPYTGSVSCSAAGTAGWLRDAPAPESPAGVFLNALQHYGAGLVPVAAPIDYFEHAWMLNTFVWHDVPHECPPEILDRLQRDLGPRGIAGGRDLTVDGDDTAAVLHALLSHGRDIDLAGLMTYWQQDHFQIYPGESISSPATNGHTVGLLRRYLAEYPHEAARYEPVLRANADWLLDQQRADGSWFDFWHVSPYYATVCAVEALTGYGGARARQAVRAAVDWVLDSRHPGGGWGVRWVSVEETAYAALVLRSADFGPRVAEAFTAAEPVLAETEVGPDITPLWLVKDYFAPIRVVAAAVLAARHAIACRR